MVKELEKKEPNMVGLDEGFSPDEGLSTDPLERALAMGREGSSAYGRVSISAHGQEGSSALG